ncbi:BTAD domain-containing putative transcriptional regulator [Modestobacter sp. I12A-02662]|uniref:ATP-binding protein n=1 Tax=Modestobacter sp. I12A-02662 TaxID=1730496 RepID=UPI0034DF4A78
MAAVVLLGVLGPVVLHAPDGSPVRLGSARQARLLAALALHVRAPVGCDLLAELVWGEQQPADPDAALHTYVGRLRRVLPPGLRIRTGTRAYLLDADPGAIDAQEFTAVLQRGPTDLESLEAALGWWRGRPYADLEHPAVETEVARLAGLRADAAERHVTALLAAARPADAVAAAEALVGADPLRESATALLMRALLAAGRPSDAARAFAALRTALADELGLDPGPEVVRLHDQVLRGVAPRRPALPLSSFVGRDDDLDRVTTMLAERRVVTLCGPGGVGKSRLARHAAAAVADRYPDGVVAVGLGDVGPSRVAPAVAAALRLAEVGAASLTERIVEVLAVRRHLLLLDDCDHVAEPVAVLVEALAGGAPGVDVLVTAREPLRADGEQVLPVAPLPDGPAAALLADRIRAADPASSPTPGQAQLLAEVCRRLDGLPLALELAAVRVPGLGLTGLLTALEEPLDVLSGGRRTAARRHRSLREVVEWSYGLLGEEHRELFVRLGVFAGAVEPAAVTAVCGSAAGLPDLVDRSLVVRRDGDPVTYGMLDTLRAFCRARLRTHPAAGDLRARHAAWAAALGAEVAEASGRPDQAAAVRRFDAHLADLRHAHAWLCRCGPPEQLLQLGLVFADLGYLRARADLVRMADEALVAAGCAPDAEPGAPVGDVHPLAPLLLGATVAAAWQRGDLDGGERRGWRALAVAEAIGEPLAGRAALEGLANVAMFRGDLDRARELCEQAAAASAAAHDRGLELVAAIDLTIIAAYAGDDAAAARAERLAAALADELGSPVARAWAAYAAGERRAESGDRAAVPHLERAVALAEEVDAAFLAGIARHTLLTTAARTDPGPAAVERFGPLLDTWHGLGAWTQLWIAVRALMEALSRDGRHRDAARLLGALRTSRRASQAYGADSDRIDRVVDAARRALGAELDDLLAEGAALGDSGALALARRLAHR